jgi:hypothetical protein
MSTDPILTQPAPTLDTLWEDARSGLIPWSAVQEFQASKMPRCAGPDHGDRPMSIYEDETPLCAECYVALVKGRKEGSTP